MPHQLQSKYPYLASHHQDGHHSGTGHVMIPYGHGAIHKGLPPAPVAYHTHAGQTPHHVPNGVLTQGGHSETHHAPTAGGSHLGLQSSSGTPPHAHHTGDSSQAIVKQHSGPHSHTASPHEIHNSSQTAPNHGEVTVSFPRSMKPSPRQVAHAIITLAPRDTADGRRIYRTPSTACKVVRPRWHRRRFSER